MTGWTETWRDWAAEDAPVPQLFTRAQFLALIERLAPGLDVSVRTLRYWEKEGILPHPARYFAAGATCAWYPVWECHLILALRLAQLRGRPLPEIGAYLRSIAPGLSRTCY